MCTSLNPHYFSCTLAVVAGLYAYFLLYSGWKKRPGSTSKSAILPSPSYKPSIAIKTHKNNREGSTEARCFHPQQVLKLRNNDVHSCCCGEASHQGLCEVNRHEAKSEKPEDKLKESDKKKRKYEIRKRYGDKIELVLFQIKTPFKVWIHQQWIRHPLGKQWFRAWEGFRKLYHFPVRL